MSIPYVTRTWLHPGGWEGPGWSRRVVHEFEAMMREAARKPRGRPALVDAWDEGRGVMCWYSAQAGADERVLRDRCRRLFGTRERDPHLPAPADGAPVSTPR